MFNLYNFNHAIHGIMKLTLVMIDKSFFASFSDEVLYVR